MSYSDSKFYERLYNYLEKLDHLDALDTVANNYYTQYDPLITTPKTSDDTKLNLYEKDQFKKFITRYIQDKHHEKPNLTKDYLEKFYRNMYLTQIYPSNGFRLYEKVMYHPDVTITDYEFLTNKLKQREYRIYQIELFLLGGLVYGYYKTSYGQKLRKNPGLTATIFGLFPITTLMVMLYTNKMCFDWKVNSMGFKDKYQLK